jgi:hypothetical protein
MAETGADTTGRILGEHCQRVFERFEGRSKAFRTVFTGVVIFGALFLLFVLVPYISLLVQGQRAALAAVRLEEDLRRHQARAEALQRPLQGMERLRQRLERGPRELRELILALARDPGPAPFVQQARAPASPACEGRSGDDRMNCLVRDHMLRTFDGYVRSLQADVVEPLRGLPAGSVSLDPGELQRRVDTLRQTLQTKLDANPRFWTTLQGKEGFQVEIDQEITRFWSDVGAPLEDKVRSLSAEVARIRREGESSRLTRELLQKQQAELAVRLKDLDSPLGKLPIGLAEAVLVFPLVLAAGFVVALVILVEAVALRAAFHALYQAKDPSHAVITEAQVALVAPLWIDPLRSPRQRLVLAAALAVPALIFVGACVLIAHAARLPDGFAAPGQLPAAAYGVLYALAAIAMTAAGVRLMRAVRRYDADRAVAGAQGASGAAVRR